MYCPVRNQHLMRSTLPTSWGLPPLPAAPGDPAITHYPRGPHTAADESWFERNFAFIGSGDFAPYLCVPAALEYRASIGGEAAIRAYCEALAREGGRKVAAVLGTEVLDNSTHTLTRCFLTNVRLPVSLAACQELAARAAGEGRAAPVRERVSATVKQWIERTTAREYHGFQAVFEYGGGWWVRLSAMVYVDMADFERTAAVLKEVAERAERGDWLGSC
jgi:selenocysteine lyase/cysteine desulfurase